MKTTTTKRPARKHADFARDFSPAVRRALLRRGIVIVGICALPDMTSSMPYANAARGYQLDDNGTGRIRDRGEVVALAGLVGVVA